MFWLRDNREPYRSTGIRLVRGAENQRPANLGMCFSGKAANLRHSDSTLALPDGEGFGSRAVARAGYSPNVRLLHAAMYFG